MRETREYSQRRDLSVKILKMIVFPLNCYNQKVIMALSSPESPVPPRRVVINRTENPSEEHEELNKMAHGVVAESRRFVLLVEFSFM